MTIAITSSGIALDGPLVAGEKVAVTVSGLALAAEDKPTLALLARFPDAILASVELAEDAQTPGTWTGELDTATKQMALFFATARADERRDAALELVAGRVSLARLTVPMANSALCPKPDGSPFASPVYVPVPGPQGDPQTPSDETPQMDGTGAAGTATTYARGNHRHPTDTSRAPLVSPEFTGVPTAPTPPPGANSTQIATTAFVQTETRYTLTAKTPIVSGAEATVACKDRAINDFIVATGVTGLTITPPAAVTGRARDFFCRVTLTDSSLPTVTLSGGTIDIGASEVAGMTHGVNLLMFTEIASGHWLASRRSAS